MNGFLDLTNGPRNLQRTSVAGLEHPQRNAFRAPWTNAGKALEFAHEGLDGGRVGDAPHGVKIRNPKSEIRNKSE
jgi:hypothetical protein